MVEKVAAKVALAGNSGIAKNGGAGSDMFVADLDSENDPSFGAKALLRRDFAKTGDENTV